MKTQTFSKLFFIATLIILSLFSFAGCKSFSTEVADNINTNVTDINLIKFSGKWYEIAAVPTHFEQGCRCITSDYNYNKGIVIQNNTCLMKASSAKSIQVREHLFPIANTGNKEFNLKIANKNVGQYKILYVDKVYQYLIITNADLRYLWILARIPAIPSAKFTKLTQIAASYGAPVDKLKLTNQFCFNNASKTHS